MDKLIKINNLDYILYNSPYINTQIKKKIKVIFADNTASGRPCPIIDKFINYNILPYYTNTRSNATCGKMMTELIEDTRKYIRKNYNLDDDHKIIFTGSGATGAINNLINVINFKKYNNVNILISKYEHYSNILPWLEVKKKYNNIELLYIPINYDNLLIDYSFIDEKMKLFNFNNENVLNIVSIIGCSNVTGIITDVYKIGNMVNTYKKNSLNDNYFFVDFAALAPHIILNCNFIDAVFISGHKFMGGNSTPGLLIAKKNIFGVDVPYNPGGGCIMSLHDNNDILYYNDIEKREPGGTMNIIGIIKYKLIIKMVKRLENIMRHNEKIINEYVYKKLNIIKEKYPKKMEIIYNNMYLDNRIPIVSLLLNFHYNLMVTILNDKFGIQTRGGISCCGLLKNEIKKIYGEHNNGWCRITFAWYMDHNTIDFILNAIDDVLCNIIEYSKMYIYDKRQNLFIFKQ
jgi:selenocysteine lyase/cysteine desulfurase